MLEIVKHNEGKFVLYRCIVFILFQTQSLSIKVSFKNILKRFAKRLWLNFTLNLSL
jgi:hypothetical protein